MDKLALQNAFYQELSDMNYNVLKLCEVGSYLYGVPKPTSDYDLRAIVMPTMENFALGQVNFSYTTELTDELGNVYDFVAYSLHKFVGVWLKGSPNVLDMLYAPNLCDSHFGLFNILRDTYNHKFLGGCLGQASKLHTDTKDLNQQVRYLLAAMEYVQNTEVKFPQNDYLGLINEGADMLSVKANLQDTVGYLYKVGLGDNSAMVQKITDNLVWFVSTYLHKHFTGLD